VTKSDLIARFGARTKKFNAKDNELVVRAILEVMTASLAKGTLGAGAA
jgi:nucleoid DNA-binding protein